MKKLVYLLCCLLLLSAGFAACSNETDDPPEQPSSHQNETPVDSASVEKDTTEVVIREFSLNLHPNFTKVSRHGSTVNSSE